MLLAPAAASFDQHPNFEMWGEGFTAGVKVLLVAYPAIGYLCQIPSKLQTAARN
jgi:hypothetical protein